MSSTNNPFDSRPGNSNDPVEDAQGRMYDLSIRILELREAGEAITAAQQAITDILWIDVQVQSNGFDGWLYYTACERMQNTLKALETIGCAEVVNLIEKALAITKIIPLQTTDMEREALVDSLSARQREKLSELDDSYYNLTDVLMTQCEAFVAVHPGEFPA